MPKQISSRRYCTELRRPIKKLGNAEKAIQIYEKGLKSYQPS